MAVRHVAALSRSWPAEQSQQKREKMHRGTLTYAGRVRPGDEVRDGEEFVLVTKINRARGRKPKVGENLRVISNEQVLKYNSEDPVRVRRLPPRRQ